MLVGHRAEPAPSSFEASTVVAPCSVEVAVDFPSHRYVARVPLVQGVVQDAVV